MTARDLFPAADGAQTFTRYLQAMAASPRDLLQAETIAQSRGHKAAADLIRKTIMTGTDIGSSEDFQAARRGFLELVRARSLTGRIAGWRRTSFHTPTLRATVAPAAAFIGQGKAIPVTQADLTPEKLPATKIATILVQTQEVATGTGPGFEAALSADLVAAVAQAEAVALTDPTNTGTPGEAPASLTAGVTPLSSTGTPADDLHELVRNFSGDLERAVLIATPALAVQLHARGYEGAGARGGSVGGIPLFTSTAIAPDSNGSPLILLDPGRVLLADDGADVTVAAEAAVQVSATPDEPTTAGTVLESLWQRNLVGFLAVRRIGWKAMPGAVAWMQDVAYVGV